MSRMLEALKHLEGRGPIIPSPPAPSPAGPPPESSNVPVETPVETPGEPVANEPVAFSGDLLESVSDLVGVANDPAQEWATFASDPDPAIASFPTVIPLAPSPQNIPLPPLAPAPAFPSPPPALDSCVLPHALRVSQRYLDLAYRIGEQVASNDCNALLFVTAGHSVENELSMTHLAQAFALQSVGKVLLVDGDLRGGELSQTVGFLGPGLTEAMLGSVPWSAVVHPTNVARVDFVPRGRGPMPILEHSELGWGSLRLQYRAILIGLAEAEQPQTTWMAARCEGVYFVISRPHTRRRLATSALQGLRAGGARVLGCIVVND